MHTERWLAYNDLAWIDDIVAAPGHYEEETERYTKLIRDNARIEPKTLLHLGSGAGGHDHTFKKHFRVTGVDISPGMLEIARKRNPEVAYVQADMRDFDLGERFDAVAIPDSIDYMSTVPDLRAAVHTACRHLRSGGVLLITAKTSEEFRNNNFAYSGSKDGIDVTVFENNYVLPSDPSRYEATLVYLIRDSGELTIYTDRHTLGVFPDATWRSLLCEAGLEVSRARMDETYNQYLLENGEYKMQIFVGLKNDTD